MKCIGSSVHSVYVARMIQTMLADTSCFTHPFLSGDGTVYIHLHLIKENNLMKSETLCPIISNKLVILIYLIM